MPLTFTTVFIALLVITTATRFWLSTRHISYVQTHRSAVPTAFAEIINLTAHQKAADYTAAKSKLMIAEALTQAKATMKIDLTSVYLRCVG